MYVCMDGWMDESNIVGVMDGWMAGWMDESYIVGVIDGWMDESYTI